MSLALVLCLFSSVTSEMGLPSSLVDHHVVVEAVPWNQLVVDRQAQRWAVVVRPSGSSALDVAGIILQQHLVEALSRNLRVRSAAGAPPDRKQAALPEDELVMRLADAHDARRILVVRLEPAVADGNPKVVLRVLDEDAKLVASATSTAVLVSKKPGLALRARPVVEEPPSDDAPTADEPETPPPTAAKRDGARDEFLRRALLAREKDDDETDRPTWVILRDGKELTDDELKELGAPALSAPRPTFWARKWPFVVFGTLEAVAAALPAVGCLVGVASGMAFCSAGYAAWAGSSGGTTQAVLDGAAVGCWYGCYLCPATGCGGLVAGGALALVTAAAGVAGMVFSPRAGKGGDDVRSFVVEHNVALAKELGIRQRRLPTRYFREK